MNEELISFDELPEGTRLFEEREGAPAALLPDGSAVVFTKSLDRGWPFSASALKVYGLEISKEEFLSIAKVRSESFEKEASAPRA